MRGFRSSSAREIVDVANTQRSNAVRAAAVPTPRASTKQLGQILVSKGHVTPGHLAEALLQQPASAKRIGELLVELALLDEHHLAEGLAEQHGLEVADLRSEQPTADAIALLPEARARSLHAVPLRVGEDGRLRVAVADPAPQALAEMRTAAGRDLDVTLAAASEIARTVDSAYRALSGVDRQISAFLATSAARRPSAKSSDSTADDAPVVQIVNMLLAQALRDRASDVHIEPQDARVRVRFRIDGALHDVIALPEDMSPALASRIKIMAGMNIVERRRPQDGQITTTIEGRPIDIRVATTGTIFGEKVVLRILDKSRRVFRLPDLGMPPATTQAYSKLIRAPYGMVICAGPTGSGKTTTLYASMSEINGTERNITTIEDPVEYVFPAINQIQINEVAGITFAGGLKSILRQDPDVILVGEIRDVETARIAVQSALTGHFVLSSLHATDAVSALHRFLDMGIESFLVASAVTAVVGQRLIRKSCPYCRVSYEPSAEELAFYLDSGGDPDKQDFTRGEGCNFCAQTGYSDRVGVYELLPVTPEVRQLLVAGRPSHEDLRALAARQGMRSMRQEALRLVESDVTTIAEVVRSIYTL